MEDRGSSRDIFCGQCASFEIAFPWCRSRDAAGEQARGTAVSGLSFVLRDRLFNIWRMVGIE